MMSNYWQDYPVPAQRVEAHFGDRLMRCFADRPPSVYATFAATVARHAGQEALVCAGKRWTWAESDVMVGRIAAVLAHRGVTQGERVAMLISNRPEFVFVLYAIQRLGAIAVPVGTREQRPGLAYVLGQCGAMAILFDDELADRIPDADEAPHVQVRMSLEVLEDLAGLQADAGALPPVAEVREEDTAVILYTSGTTGHPKGAMLTHLNIIHSVMHYEACMRLTARDRSALAVPASHVTGLIATVASMTYVGGAIVIVPAFRAADFVALMAHERVTHTLMVPAMYNLCLLQPDFAHHDLSAWRIGGFGGAPMPAATIAALAERLPGLIPLNAYGATETTSPTTMMPMGRTADHIDSVGVMLPCADVRVMDENGHEVAPGASGELWIGGPMVASGYWDNARATASNFTAGYWHSGDIGAVDADGYVRVFDRMKDMLNRGGFKIYSVEVENTLMALPGVLEAAIVGIPCPVLGERVHAFIHAAQPLADDVVRDYCRARLADYKVPETITWCAEPLPRNANGKLLKRALRERLGGAAVSPSATSVGR